MIRAAAVVSVLGVLCTACPVVGADSSEVVEL
jgi:hypothetical protein